MIDADLLERVAAARSLAVRWLTDRIAPDGQPIGALERNAWWRVPWALVVSGEPAAAATVLAWAERHALTDGGDLAPGPYGGGTPQAPVYYLSPLAIAAWHLERFATARAIMGTLRTFQSPHTGGAYLLRRPAQDDTQDMLRTAQLGIAALTTGDDDVAAGVARWLEGIWFLQPDLPRRLYTCRTDSGLVTEVQEANSFEQMVDFTAPRQAYYNPGIAAAFLALHAGRTRDGGGLEIPSAMLDLNRHGNSVQFEDTTSVQICKYGWGAAVMSRTTRDASWTSEAVRMAEWFMDRQNPDGSWSPSSFITPDPTDTDRLWKTAEHVMELSYIYTAMAVAMCERESSAAS